tara:strand:- start:952 stop:1161 length:210 start_codon:yes stop_codon:yes gene_type:complete
MLEICRIPSNEEIERMLREIRGIDMAKVWREYSRSIAPILAANKRARIESMYPKNSRNYGSVRLEYQSA